MYSNVSIKPLFCASCPTHTHTHTQNIRCEEMKAEMKRGEKEGVEEEEGWW
jgi:hypothetical protein